MTEVSRGHSSWRKRALKKGGLTLTKARTVPIRMVWVNGCGCQRTGTYRLNAAVAEMSIAARSGRPGSVEFAVSTSAITSRTAVYGPVRTVVWEGRSAMGVPIPIGGVQLSRLYLNLIWDAHH